MELNFDMYPEGMGLVRENVYEGVQRQEYLDMLSSSGQRSQGINFGIHVYT